MSRRDEEIAALTAELRALMDRARPIVEKLTSARPAAEELAARPGLGVTGTEEEPGNGP